MLHAGAQDGAVRSEERGSQSVQEAVYQGAKATKVRALNGIAPAQPVPFDAQRPSK